MSDVDLDSLTRDQLDDLAVEKGIDPSSCKTKADVVAAIEATYSDDGADDSDAPDAIDPDDVPKGTVLTPLTHDGKVVPVGSKVPKSLSDEAVETLREQGDVK